MRMNPNISGRFCLVRDLKEHGKVCVGAILKDEFGSQRVRLQTGEHFGESRKKGEFMLMEYCAHDECDHMLENIWAEAMA